MKKLLITTLLLLCTFTLSACEKKESKVMNETIVITEASEDLIFKNDLKVTNIGDPFMLKIAEDDYYMYCTSAANGFYCWHSKDMIHWSKMKMCYVRPNKNAWSTECYWAPEVVPYNGKYYMFYTARHTSGSLKIGLAISDSPAGPFIDFKDEPLFDPGYAFIDGNVFIDDDGSKYLYYSRDCSENIVDGIHTSQVYGVQLTDDLTGIIGEPILLTTPVQKWERQSGNYAWNEGPEMIKHNGVYYLTYSANYYESPAYSLGYATSASPLGEFKKADNNPILTSLGLKDVSGPGHHSFVLSPDGSEVWAAYHSHTSVKAPSGNRKVNIAKCVFDENGLLYINGPLTVSQPVPSGLHGIINKTASFESPQIKLDEIIQVHSNDTDLATSFEVNNEHKVILDFTADNISINGIAIHYLNENDFASISSIKISANGTDCSNDFVTDTVISSPLIVSFDDITVTSLTIELTLSPDVNAIDISEVEFFGKN